jgi:probable F420-dependent oxidoreductase
MQLDVTIGNPSLQAVPALTRRAEEIGFGAMWTTEMTGNAFLPLAVAAVHSERILLGTSIALAFVRSPMVTALDAWHLAKASNGRFILGLGTQVKTHNQRRYAVPYEHPGPKLREQILALRHIWGAFQGEHELQFHGKFYQFDYLPPIWNPGPIAHPYIPVYIAAVGEYMCRMAGEVCDGIHVHPFHTVKYLREVMLPAIAAGAARAGRDASAIKLSTSLFIITGDTPEERAAMKRHVRGQIGFYGATRTYEPVFAIHGWTGLTAQLQRHIRNGSWATIGDLIPDEVLDAFAITCDWDEIPAAVHARYGNLLDRVSIYMFGQPAWMDQPERWIHLVRGFAALS